MGSMGTWGVYVRGDPGLVGGEPTRNASEPSAVASPGVMRLAWVFPCGAAGAGQPSGSQKVNS
jgi:hypothetical protein